MKRKRKSIRNSKGLNTLQTVIISITILICAGFFIDLINITEKQQAVSMTSTFVSRIISKQGGVRTAEPKEFKETDDYVNSAELYNKVKKVMNNADVKDTDWTLQVRTPLDGLITIKPTTNLSLTDIDSAMEVVITVKYEWELASKLTPITPKGTIKSKRAAYSSLKVRNTSNVGSTFK